MKTATKIKTLLEMEAYQAKIKSKTSEIDSHIKELKTQISDLEKRKQSIISPMQKKIDSVNGSKSISKFIDEFNRLCDSLGIKKRNDFMQLLKLYSIGNFKILYYNIANPKHSTHHMNEADYITKRHMFVKIDVNTLEIIKNRVDKIDSILNN
jgi:hypothetical protein